MGILRKSHREYILEFLNFDKTTMADIEIDDNQFKRKIRIDCHL